MHRTTLGSFAKQVYAGLRMSFSNDQTVEVVRLLFASKHAYCVPIPSASTLHLTQSRKLERHWPVVAVESEVNYCVSTWDVCTLGNSYGYRLAWSDQDTVLHVRVSSYVVILVGV